MYEKCGTDYELFYRYDVDGRLFQVIRNRLSDNYKYYYYIVTNIFGDVLQIRDGSGNILAKYNYDSWGKLLSITNSSGTAFAENTYPYHISVRYRGYVYDHETGLYYLQSRYYDPETGRFINADDVDYIGYSGEDVSYNMFAYCENNTVNGWDPLGKVAFIVSKSAPIKDVVWLTQLYTQINVGNRLGSYRINSYSYSKYRVLKVYYNLFNKSYFKSRAVDHIYAKSFDEWKLYISAENNNLITRFRSKIKRLLKLTGKEFDKAKQYIDALADIADVVLESLGKPATAKFVLDAIDISECLINYYYDKLSVKFKYIRNILKNVENKYQNNRYLIFIQMYVTYGKQVLRANSSTKYWQTYKTVYYY